ncbi:unnamed protein product [Cylicostephanus goldi]|uniref:3'-5' exonuclease domain-containing protein n=1 Tax=Cylicostephanus goldi TaxID=71465 RepID=A0A3P6U023_CYLGO|nr:unnamed protein product [Cylicostephanus goldi]
MEKRAEDVGEEEALELIPGYPIILVDDKKSFCELVSRLKDQDFIGIDSEWKAQYLFPNESVALLQIAIIDGVYLVDFCALENSLTENDWDALLRSLLCSQSRKLGFDLGNDLRALFAGAPTGNVQSIADNLCNVVCLKRLVENVSFLSVC